MSSVTDHDDKNSNDLGSKLCIIEKATNLIFLFKFHEIVYNSGITERLQKNYVDTNEVNFEILKNMVKIKELSNLI